MKTLLIRALIGLCLLPALVIAQSPPTYTVKRTEHGHPDLQGNWTNPFQTPLERPTSLGMKASYTPQEATALTNRALSLDIDRQAAIDPNRPAPELGAAISNQADGNFEIMPTALAYINGKYPTAYIVDPPDGRLPYRPDAAGNTLYGKRATQGFDHFQGPENLTPLDRCLSGSTPLPLLRAFFDADVESGGNPGGDNPIRNVQIVQNKDYVAILSEYFSQARIIRLADEHLSGRGRQWMGDSIGHYEGDTLVIHTRNFKEEQSTVFMRISGALEVEERYTRIGEDDIHFQFTVTDPEIYSQPFTVEMSLKKMPAGVKLYEYACHEGNYSLPSMLMAVRMKEQGLLD